jgi:hypothetical protein
MTDWQRPQDPSAPQGGWQPGAQPGPYPGPGQQRGVPASPPPAGWSGSSAPGQRPAPAPRRGSQPPSRPSAGGSGIALSFLVVGAVVGLIVGAVGFFALAPADGAIEDETVSGVTVTTSAGAGGTEGEAAAAGQAATPEEQAIYDLAAAFNEEDCATILELTEVSFWQQFFEESIDEEEEAGRCEDGFASGTLGPVRIYQTWILGTGENGETTVAARNDGWYEGNGGPINSFMIREEDGAWRVFTASYDSSVVERGAAETEARGEGDESGGGELDMPSGRPVVDPTEPPTGNASYDEIAQNCFDGSMVACDDLYWVAPRGSEYELYGITCGGRRLGVFAGGQCERDFNRQVDD